MPRLLRGASVAAQPQQLGGNELLLDPALQAKVDHEIAQARQLAFAEGQATGHEAGVVAGREEAMAQAAQTSQIIASHVEQLTVEVARTRRDMLERLETVALEIAQSAVGELDGLAETVRHRVALALDHLDDVKPTVFVASGQEALVATLRDVHIEVDPDLQPGDARISGEWCDADLRLATIWEGLSPAARPESADNERTAASEEHQLDGSAAVSPQPSHEANTDVDGDTDSVPREGLE